MFYSQIDKMIEACYEELLQAPDQEIQDALELLRKNVPNHIFKHALCGFIRDGIKMSMLHDLDEEEFDEFFIMNIKGFAEHSINIKKSIVVEVKMKGQEEHINRVLEIPYVFTVADLAYAVLASMNSFAYHMFSVKYKKEKYYCEVYENDWDDEEVNYASATMLDELHLRKGSKLQLTYDFGDDFEFEVIVKEIKKHQEAFGLENMNIQQGKGYGIWEDAHYEMDLFYDNRDAFNRYLDENGLDAEMYPCDEIFELDVMNDIFTSEFVVTKQAYEEPEEFELPYLEDSDDDIHLSDDDLPF